VPTQVPGVVDLYDLDCLVRAARTLHAEPDTVLDSAESAAEALIAAKLVEDASVLAETAVGDKLKISLLDAGPLYIVLLSYKNGERVAALVYHRLQSGAAAAAYNTAVEYAAALARERAKARGLFEG